MEANHFIYVWFVFIIIWIKVSDICILIVEILVWNIRVNCVCDLQTRDM